jgi:hypothetical protein
MAKNANIEVGDELVLSVPVVRVDDNGHWSTVTFSLSTGQRVTLLREARHIVEVKKVQKERGRRKTLFDVPD